MLIHSVVTPPLTTPPTIFASTDMSRSQDVHVSLHNLSILWIVDGGLSCLALTKPGSSGTCHTFFCGASLSLALNRENR